jgi:hypothetical protein
MYIISCSGVSASAQLVPNIVERTIFQKAKTAFYHKFISTFVLKNLIFCIKINTKYVYNNIGLKLIHCQPLGQRKAFAGARPTRSGRRRHCAAGELNEA